VKAFSRVLLKTSYSLTGRLLFDGKAALRREGCSLTGRLLLDGMAAKEDEVGQR
jgi:hypothetical protein